jgi:hypothetical protein
MKNYRITFNVGRVKYLISYHDGIKKHKDGSPFYDIDCFSNKTKFNKHLKHLISQGYVQS